jgi:hypothetical protein
VADILSRDFALSDEEVTSYSTPLLTFGSPVLQDHPFAGSNHFSHWRAAAAVAQVTASTLGVTTKLTSLDSFFTVTTI